ncbi:MAG TPA: ABC transporter ATP-binding protein [Firmicutes bacterium]|nr:ABC transporter ATP-binding protein [Bacillota bacterium]
MLELNNISMQFGGRTLFKDVDIKFNKNECYGLIGANGAGKSTLLRIISGDLEPTTGNVALTGGERLSVLKQDHNEFNDLTVLETVLRGYPELIKVRDEKDAIYMKADFSEEDGIKAGELEEQYANMGGWESESNAQTLLTSLGVDSDLHEKLMKDIDVKLRVKVLLARALFGNPDILVLDEPTNNLDAKAAMWLENFLAEFENTIIIVSHDRYFLNKVCTRILDVDFGRITSYIGNYDFYFQSSQLALKQMKDSNAKKEQKIKELEDFIRRFGANASKSKQATSRKKLLEKITLDDIIPSSRKMPFIEFRFEKNIGRDVLEVHDLTVNGLFKNLSFNLRREDKVAIIAENSNVTTALFEVLAGKRQADSGTFKYGVTITPMYFPTDLKEFDNVELSLVDYLRPFSSETLESYIRGFLGRMLFSGEESLKPVKVLSGGEKVRLKLTEMMMKPGNLAIFDDPTNHLDMESIQALDNAMNSYRGIILFTSHDHQLLQSVANRIIYIKDENTIIDKFSTYNDFFGLE